MNRKEKFEDLQLDFYHWMIDFGGVRQGTRNNYISWLKFLSEFYDIDYSITKEYIDFVIESENKNRIGRKQYSRSGDLSNFKSALRKFMGFVNSDYEKKYADRVLAEIKKIEDSKTLPITDKEIILKARVGQGLFRQKLIEYWGGCAITGCGKKDLLLASHIKPWKDANNDERLDVYNGLLLLPNYDKLFDKGYLTFLPNGEAKYSKMLSKNDRLSLGLQEGVVLKRIDERHKTYLEYHNDRCFFE